MTTDKYLKQIRRLNLIILNRAEEYENLMGAATNMVAPTDSEPSGGGAKDKIGNLVVNYVDTQRYLSDIMAKRDKILRQIENLSNETSYNILFRYYVLEESYTELSRNLNYSKTHVARLHHKALDEFEHKYGVEYLKK